MEHLNNGVVNNSGFMADITGDVCNVCLRAVSRLTTQDRHQTHSAGSGKCQTVCDIIDGDSTVSDISRTSYSTHKIMVSDQFNISLLNKTSPY